MVNNKLMVFILVMSSLSFANEASIINKELKVNSSEAISITKKPLNVDSNIINKVDQDADNINALKRKLELERIKADIQKTKNDNKNSSVGSTFGETTVTAVFMDEDGTKYATLQFVDGSNLDVEIGSLIGQYAVADISMAAVTLKKEPCKKKECIQKITIKRQYSKINNLVTNNAPVTYMPTPAIMDKNDQTVPPIISNR